MTTREHLLALYGAVPVRAAGKVHPALDAHDRAFVAASPFLVLATTAPGGLLDCSPRGDLPGFVHVLDDGRMVLPDRPGNNRVDSLLNVVADPRASLILLVPGRHAHAARQRHRRRHDRPGAARARRGEGPAAARPRWCSRRSR